MILIVGGGPAGSLSAIALKDFDVTLVEEHQSAGFPVQCAGLISENCYKILRRFSDCKINKIRGAVFSSPKKSVELEGKVKGIVIDRKILDRDLLLKASEYAKILVKTKFVGIRDGKAILRGLKDECIKYDYIIGADGVYSTVAKVFGFDRPKVYSALQFTVKYDCISNDLVEIYFGFSDFFCYAIPIDEFAKIGVITSENAYGVMNKFLKWLGKRVRGSIVEMNAGAIPIGLVDFVKENVILLGDSAGMVKPYTGGGLYYIVRAVEKLRHFPNLKKIRDDYLKDLGIEYKIGMKIANLYKILDADDFDYLISIARDYSDLAKELDMDRPSTIFKILPLLLKIIKNRKILRALLR